MPHENVSCMGSNGGLLSYIRATDWLFSFRSRAPRLGLQPASFEFLAVYFKPWLKWIRTSQLVSYAATSAIHYSKFFQWRQGFAEFRILRCKGLRSSTKQSFSHRRSSDHDLDEALIVSAAALGHQQEAVAHYVQGGSGRWPRLF